MKFYFTQEMLMLTIIIKRSQEPTVIQMTYEDIARQAHSINGAEILVEDSWTEGLRKVRTPMVCLVEADCVLSAHYLSSNFGLMNQHVTKGGKGGGYNRLAMISSCLGIKRFDDRIYNYELKKVKDKDMKYHQIQPEREKRSTSLYHVQVGFVPGAIMRMRSLDIDSLPWDSKNLVEMSTIVSFHLWNTGRRIQLNPNTTYVSGDEYIEHPPKFDPKLPDNARNIFTKERI